MPVKPIPDGFHSVTPYIVCRDVAGLIEFLKAAFGAVEKERHLDDQGRIMHAELLIGDSILMMGEASERHAPRSACFYMYVPDVDATYQAALKAGGKSVGEPTNHFYGDRSGGVDDPAGNQWWIGTHIEDVSEEELKRRMSSLKPQ